LRINRIIPILLAIYSSAISAAVAQTGQSRLNQATEQELQDLTRNWDQALLKKDVDALDKILAPDYTFAGTVKSYYLAVLKTPDVEYISYERRDIEIRVYGDAALVFSYISVTGKFPGVDSFWSNFHALDVWIRQDRRWKCVATMNDEIKGETRPGRTGRVEFGPQVKADIVILFRSGTTDQQIEDFLHSVLQRPNPYGAGYKNQPAVRGILRVPAIEGFQALEVTFHDDAIRAEKDEIKSKTKSASSVYAILDDIAPRDVKLK
jgi:ketosteroid isomerase-like protein